MLPLLRNYPTTLGASTRSARQFLYQVVGSRSAHASAGKVYPWSSLPTPAPAKIQVKPPAGEKGYFRYERCWSRDARYAHQKGHALDTIPRFFRGTIFELWELIPLHVGMAVAGIAMIIVIYYSCHRLENQLNRSDKRIPQDWERCRDNYWKLPKRLYDATGGHYSDRLPIMEVLEDEMLEAARARGTR